MLIKNIEKKLLDDDLHIYGCAIRRNNIQKFSSPKEAKNFLVCHLTLTAISGVNFSKFQLLVTYAKIFLMVTLTDEISTRKIPIHREKQLSDNAKYVLDDCYCKRIPIE